MSKSEKINNIGKLASIYYKGGATELDYVDDHSTGQPLQVILGAKRLPVGIEEALETMEVGEERELVIPSEKGYGFYNEKDVQWYPRSMLDFGYDMHTGMVLYHENYEDHSKRPGRVVDETQDTIKVDFNHPFAGKELSYWVKLVALD